MSGYTSSNMLSPGCDRTRTLLPLWIGLVLGVCFAPCAAQEADAAGKDQDAAQPMREERHARHILIETEAEADDLVRRCREGENFVALCRKHSLDAVTKKIGGDLGWVRENGWPGIDAPLFSIPEVGEVAKGQTQYGWHVIQFVDVRQKPIKKKKKSRPRTKKVDRKPNRVKQDRTRRRAEALRERRRRRADAKNSDLDVTVTFDKLLYTPDEDITFTIVIENRSEKILNMFHPDLWPLGFIVRYRHKPRPALLPILAPHEGDEPEGGYYRDLEAGEAHTQTFRLQDYVEEVWAWPKLRLAWRGELFFSNLSDFYPEVASHSEFQSWSDRWYHYSSRAQMISILPELRAGERWYACAYFGMRPVWIEITDPGVPGLLEAWSRNVMADRYTKAELSRQVPGEYLFFGDVEGVDPIPLAEPWSGEASTAPYTVGLALDRNVEGHRAGPGLFFGLGDPSKIAELVVPIGKVVGNQKLLDGIAENKVDRRSIRGSRITALELYPEAILPASARASIEGKQAVDAKDLGKRRLPEGVKSRPRSSNFPVVELELPEFLVQIELFEDHAPNTVANFIQLVEEGYYRGKTFHARTENLVNAGWIQGGCPNGTGTGALDFTIKDEVSKKLGHARGTVAMASERSGTANSASCQFYVCFAPQPQLDGTATIFGRVVGGLSQLQRVEVPLMIQDARVLHRREHEYKAERVSTGGG